LAAAEKRAFAVDVNQSGGARESHAGTHFFSQYKQLEQFLLARSPSVE
jgi:hypothetical protein